MKTKEECLCFEEVETVRDFNLQEIFVLSQAITLLELTYNLMVSISICFSSQTWFQNNWHVYDEALCDSSWRLQAVKSCWKVLHLIICRVPGSTSGKIILQYELFRQKPFWTKYVLFDKISSSRWFNVYSFSIMCKQIFIEAEYSWKDWLSQV